MRGRPGILVFVLQGALGALLLSACAEPEPPPEDSGPPEVFIALDADFRDFRSWTRFEVDGTAAPIEGVFGPTYVYVNQLPPTGLRRFPVATIFVKTIEVGPPEEWYIHAMVKRGGGFNPQFAANWEFFELRIVDGVPLILWRGEGPPGSGGGYQRIGDPTGESLTCNDCHAIHWQNDAVINPHVRLSY